MPIYRPSSTADEPGSVVESFLKVKDQKFGKKLGISLIAGLTVGTLIAVATSVTLGEMTYFRRQAVQTHNVYVAVGAVDRTIDVAESAERGYVITGSADYLSQYEAAKAELPAKLDSLTSISSGPDTGTVRQLTAEAYIKVGELDTVVAMRQSTTYDPSQIISRTEDGNGVMQQIHGLVSTLSSQCEDEFGYNVSQVSKLYQRIVLLLFLLLISELALFLGVVFMIMRDRAERLVNARVLRAQNERLRDQRDNLNFANDHLEVAFKRFQSLFQGVPVSCCCTGPKGEILEWNKASEKLFGYTTEEATKLTIYESIIRTSGFTHARNMSAGVMAGESYENVEWICRTKDGREIEVLSNAMPLEGEDGLPLGVMTATIDMTERKAVERLKSEFVSTVSHELRTPLTSIRGALGLVCSGAVGRLPEQARRLCDIANNNTERLVRLINDILDIEKIEAGNLAFSIVDCSITELARNAVDSIRNYAEQFSVRVVLVPDETDVRVSVDPDRLTQVLNNLISNGIKFSPPYGEVVVRVERIEESVRVSVTDSGSGIPEEFRPRVFGRFAQADSADTRQKGGTGLGLSISKVIIERLNGHIWFDALEQGTRFSFELPEAPEGHVNVPIEGSAKVLICEDDKDVVNVLLALLDQKGIQAHVAYNASQAKNLLSDDYYDVMILDILLPDLNGLDLLQEIRKEPKTEHLPIIVVSVTSPHGLHAIKGDGIIDWMGKPLDSKRFIETVLHAIMVNTTESAKVT